MQQELIELSAVRAARQRKPTLHFWAKDVVNALFFDGNELLARLHGNTWRVRLLHLSENQIQKPCKLDGVLLPPMFRVDLVRECRIGERTHGKEPLLHHRGFIPLLREPLPWFHPTRKDN